MLQIQGIHIKKYDWYCTIYYDAGERHIEMIMRDLEKLGVNDYELLDAEYSLHNNPMNSGLTFTSFDKRISVMVIRETTSAAEFQNSFDHEKGHLAKHIAQYYGIDPFGEEYEYLAGTIGQMLFPVAKYYLCDCCRRKLFHHK